MSSDSVLEAARKLLSEETAATFSLRKLAAVLGVSPGVLHARFGTKNELLAHVYLQRLRELGRSFRAGDLDALELEDLLRALSVPLSDLRTEFAVRFEIEGAPAQGVRSSTWQSLRDEYLVVIRRVYGLVQGAAARQGTTLIGGRLAERLIWSLLSGGTSDRNARVFGHRNSSYFRFLARSILTALAVADRD